MSAERYPEGVSEEAIRRLEQARQERASRPAAAMGAGGLFERIVAAAHDAAERDARRVREEADRAAEHDRRMRCDPAYRREVEAREHERAARRLDAAKRRLMECGFPRDDVQQCSWEGIEGADERLALQGVVAAPELPRHLLIRGPRGVGKSYASLLCAAEAVARFAWMRPVWIPWWRLSIHAFQPPAEWLAAPLAVLDDLGADESTAPGRSVLEMLWRERGGNGLLTWATTNAKDWKSLAEMIGGPLLDVIMDRRKLALVDWRAMPSRRTGLRGGRA